MCKYFIGLLLTLFVTTSFAITLNVYEKPENNAKIITTLQSGESIIPIFYTEKKDWVKIANPKNGDTGWAKTSELQGPIIVTNVNDSIVQQQVIVGGNETPSNVYGIIQYSSPQKLTPGETKKIADEFAVRQKEMRDSMQKMGEEMQKTMKNMFNGFDNILNSIQIIQPVIVVPDKSKATTTGPKKIEKK